jgi:hypothetical protein
LDYIMRNLILRNKKTMKKISNINRDTWLESSSLVTSMIMQQGNNNKRGLLCKHV